MDFIRRVSIGAGGKAMVTCENCKTIMKRVYHNLTKREKVEIYKCPKCKLIWAPALDIDTSFKSRLNEQKRQEAINKVREGEFENVLQLIRRHITAGNGLEVGCSYGQFMQKAKQYFKMEGVEAEEAVAEEARKRGLCVYTGLFPQNFTGESRKYDLIIFNNVWEHINQTVKLIKSCLYYLAPGGYLIVTVPISEGGMYKIAVCLERLGRTKELTRLWQLHFHSPHIYYFNRNNLKDLMSKNGLKLAEYKEIRSIDVNTMQQRFEMDSDEKHGALKAYIFRCVYPILRLLPADKAVFMFHYSEHLGK